MERQFQMGIYAPSAASLEFRGLLVQSIDIEGNLFAEEA